MNHGAVSRSECKALLKNLSYVLTTAEFVRNNKTFSSTRTMLTVRRKNLASYMLSPIATATDTAVWKGERAAVEPLCGALLVDLSLLQHPSNKAFQLALPMISRVLKFRCFLIFQDFKISRWVQRFNTLILSKSRLNTKIGRPVF